MCGEPWSPFFWANIDSQYHCSELPIFHATSGSETSRRHPRVPQSLLNAIVPIERSRASDSQAHPRGICCTPPNLAGDFAFSHFFSNGIQLEGACSHICGLLFELTAVDVHENQRLQQKGYVCPHTRNTEASRGDSRYTFLVLATRTAEFDIVRRKTSRSQSEWQWSVQVTVFHINGTPW